MQPHQHTPVNQSFSWDFRNSKSPEHSRSQLRDVSRGLRSFYNRCCKWQKGNISGPINGYCQQPLVFGTVAGNSGRCNFAPFSGKISDNLYILIIDAKTAVRTELAYLSSMIGSFEFTPVPVTISASIICSIICHFHPRFLRLFLPQSPLFLRPLPFPHFPRPSKPQDRHYHSA